MRASTLALAFALALTPGAFAYVDVCWELAGACAYSNAWSAGEGTCDEGAPDRYEFRTLRVSWERENVTRTIEVENGCAAHARENASWQSSDLRVHYTEYNATSREYSWAWLDWYGTDHSENGSSCATRVWTNDLAPTDDANEDLGCPAGRPPLALLALP